MELIVAIAARSSRLTLIPVGRTQCAQPRCYSRVAIVMKWAFVREKIKMTTGNSLQPSLSQVHEDIPRHTKCRNKNSFRTRVSASKNKSRYFKKVIQQSLLLLN